MTDLPEKRYADVSVQTSPPPSDSLDLLELQRPGREEFDTITSTFDCFGSFLPTPNRSRQSTTDEKYIARMPPDCAGDGAFSSLRTGTRTSKPHLQSNRPTQVLKGTNMLDSSRCFSLPQQGTPSTPTLSWTTVHQASPRVVSMPLSLQKLATSKLQDQINPIPLPLWPDVADSSHSSGRFSSQTADIPHTPSPPSSPESIEIIENSVRLPATFLRASIHEIGKYPDDQGWLNWANSPPRPIPALHGPASLPYARCPSGAEGTLIEEQSHVPRLIWGLGEDEATPNYSHSRSVSLSNRSEYSPQRHRTTSAPGIFPLRIQASELILSSAKVNPASLNKLKPRGNSIGVWKENFAPRNLQPQISTDLERYRERRLSPESYLGPINTAVPKQCQVNGHMRSTSTERKLQDFTSRAVHAGIHARLEVPRVMQNLPLSQPYYPPSSNQDSSNGQDDLEQALTYHQQRHGHITFSSSEGVDVERERQRLLALSKSSAQTVMPSHVHQLSSSQYSRLPILPQNTPSSQPQKLFNGSTINGQSAMYNSNQPPRLRQQQLLPTPPNSSSPIWSSTLLPYGCDIILPETPALTPMGTTREETVTLHDTVRLEELSHQLRQFVCDRMTSNGQDPKPGMPRTQTLGPAADISVLTPSSATARPQPGDDLRVLARSSDAFRIHDLISSATPRTSPLLARLGAATIPPPTLPTPTDPDQRKPNNHPPHNTYPSLNSMVDRLTLSSGSDLNATARPRSIPLARLIERRLASVPEEETGSGTNSRKATSERTLSSIGQLIRLPVPALPTTVQRVPSPLTSRLVPHSQIDDLSLEKEPKIAQVKLPTAKPGKSSKVGENKENDSKKKRTKASAYRHSPLPSRPRS